MSNQYIGEIRPFGFNFAPVSWLACNGQVLAISQYTPLFSIIGTTFGGNGTSTFALPNLQARFVVGTGSAPGLSAYTVGQTGGSNVQTLLSSTMPSHTHTLTAAASGPSNHSPSGAFLATLPRSAQPIYAPAAQANTNLSASSINLAGSGIPFGTAQPYLAVNFCIAVNGAYPTRT